MQRQNIAHDHVQADFVRCLRLPGAVFWGYANESANFFWLTAEAHSEPCQTSKMELFCKK